MSSHENLYLKTVLHNFVCLKGQSQDFRWLQMVLIDRAQIHGVSLDVNFFINASKAKCQAADHFPSPAGIKILTALYQLENLRQVGAFPGFYCPPAQQAPASAIAWRSCPTAGSEICSKCHSSGGEKNLRPDTKLLLSAIIKA